MPPTIRATQQNMQFVRSKKFLLPVSAEEVSRKDVLRLTAAHYGDQMLTAGLSDGSFVQYRKKEFDQKHFLMSKEHQMLRFSEVKQWHRGEITCLLVEQINGTTYILTGSYDRTIKLWENDYKTKACIQTLVGHNGTIMAMCYGADTLFTASNDKTLKIWKQESGREYLFHPWLVVFQSIYDFSMKKTLNYQAYMTCFLLKSGPIFNLYAGDTDGTLHMLKFEEDYKPTKSFRQFEIAKSYFGFHRIHILQIIEIEKDNAIFSIGYDQKIMGFGESGGKFFTYKNPHKCLFTSIQWSQTHQELIVADEQGRIYFMNISSDKQVLEFKLYTQKVLRIQLIESLDRLIVYLENMVDVLEIKRGVRAGNVLDHHKGPIIGIVTIEFPRIKNQYVEPDKLITASLDNTIGVWDPKDMSCLAILENSDKNEIAAVHYLNSANLLASGHDNGEIRLWNTEIGSYIVLDQSKTKSRHINTVCALTSNVFPSGEEYLFSSGYDGKINVWEIFERKQRMMASYIMPQLKFSVLVKPRGHADSLGYEILCLLFDKKTNCIVAAGNEGKIYFIEMTSYEHRIVFEGHRDSVLCLAIDDNILFSGSHDKTIRLWDTIGCQFLTSFVAHEGGISALMILPQTGHLVSIGQNLLQVWDYPNQKCVGKIQKPETFRSLAYLEAERTFFIGTEEHNIHSVQLEDVLRVSVERLEKPQFGSAEDNFKKVREEKRFVVVNQDGISSSPESSPTHVRHKQNTRKSITELSMEQMSNNDFLKQLEEKQKQTLQELMK